MSLFKRNNNLFEDSFFNDDFENEFFNHPLIHFPSVYPYYYHHPMEGLEKQLSKSFDKIDFSPKVNLSEDEKNYYIHADLPGLNKDQVKMEVSENEHLLTISGERETIIDNSNDNAIGENDQSKDQKESNKNENKKNNKKYSRIECSYGKFSRSFSIPENANINDIQAKMENGTLEVILPKLTTPKSEPKHTIQIQ